MNKLFEELDFRETPIGDLVRQRRKFRVVLLDIEHSPRKLLDSNLAGTEPNDSARRAGLDGEGRVAAPVAFLTFAPQAE